MDREQIIDALEGYYDTDPDLFEDVFAQVVGVPVDEVDDSGPEGIYSELSLSKLRYLLSMVKNFSNDGTGSTLELYNSSEVALVRDALDQVVQVSGWTREEKYVAERIIRRMRGY